MKQKLVLYILTLLYVGVNAQVKCIVDKNDKHAFHSIQQAILSLPDSSATPAIIFIKNGTYNEQLKIEKHHIVLMGESTKGVIVTQSISRDIFRCENADDWGVATVNVNGNDVIFMNMTIINAYGLEHPKDTVITCLADTLTHQKKVSSHGHQMALRTMKATRFIAVNCDFISYGGDTVSPWNVDNGSFYFKNCYMEGGVDLYCPRGWSWAENCRFNATSGSAIIWHDGSKHASSISVLNQCAFDGYPHFKLGRYHRDAQMLLRKCSFSGNMLDSAIYHVSNSTNTPWGHRIYFEESQSSTAFSWTKNNTAGTLMNQITQPDESFYPNRWNPENEMNVLLSSMKKEEKN